MESWEFGYRFKRGDVCNYCGTVFGGKIETYCEGRSKSGLFVALQSAVGVAKKVCERAAGARPCPRCGRLPSEAYAGEFNAASLLTAAAGPLLGAAGAGMIVGLGLSWGLDEAKYGFWGLIVIAGVIAATSGAFLSRFVKRHIVFFRSPEANLKAMERANAAEARRRERRATRNNAGSDEETLGVDEAPSRSVGIDEMILGRFNASAPLGVEPSEIWGVCPERATSPELKGRLGFQALSAARIWAVGGWFLASAAACFGLVFPQAFRAAEPFFLASARIWGAPIRIPARLASAAGIEPSPLTFVLAAFAAAIAFRVVWARRVERIRFQGNRHFGCGWERFDGDDEAEAEKEFDKETLAKARLEFASLRETERRESARTVEILRSASELTPEGAEALRIAEAEVAAAEKKDDAE